MVKSERRVNKSIKVKRRRKSSTQLSKRKVGSRRTRRRQSKRAKRSKRKKQRGGATAEEEASVFSELEGMKVSALRKRAAASGVTSAQIGEADDAGEMDEVRMAFIRRIMEKEGASAPTHAGIALTPAQMKATIGPHLAELDKEHNLIETAEASPYPTTVAPTQPVLEAPLERGWAEKALAKLSLVESDDELKTWTLWQESVIADLNRMISKNRVDKKTCMSHEVAAACTVLSEILLKNTINLDDPNFSESRDKKIKEAKRLQPLARLKMIQLCMNHIVGYQFIFFLSEVGRILNDNVSGDMSYGLVANGLSEWLMDPGKGHTKPGLFEVIFSTILVPLEILRGMVDTLEFNINRIIVESQRALQMKHLLQNGISALSAGGSWSTPLGGFGVTLPVGAFLMNEMENVAYDKGGLGRMKNKVFASLHKNVRPEAVDAVTFLHNTKDTIMSLIALLSKYTYNLEILCFSLGIELDNKESSQAELSYKADAQHAYDKGGLENLMDSTDADEADEAGRLTEEAEAHGAHGGHYGQLYVDIKRIVTDSGDFIEDRIKENKRKRMEVFAVHPAIVKSLRVPSDSIQKYGGPYLGADKVFAEMIPQVVGLRETQRQLSDGIATSRTTSKPNLPEALIDHFKWTRSVEETAAAVRIQSVQRGKQGRRELTEQKRDAAKVAAAAAKQEERRKRLEEWTAKQQQQQQQPELEAEVP